MSPIIFLYLDPGSGSLIVQAVIGAVAAAGVAIKLFWHRILRILGIKKGPKPQSNLTDKSGTDSSD
jgi:hypothetical protein